MPDEEIIKGLECCIKCCTDYSNKCGKDCPYYGNEEERDQKCFENLLKDTLRLIKRLRSTLAILGLTDTEIGTIILQTLREKTSSKEENQNENN